MPISKALQTLMVTAFSLIASISLAQQPVAANGGEAKQSKANSPTLTRAEFESLTAHPEQVLIVDVRRPDEIISIGSFPVYLSIQLADLEKSLAWIPKDRKVITVSNHAGRAGRAGDLLASKGFNVVGVIGVQNYEADGGKLSKIAPKPAQAADAAKTAAAVSGNAK